MLSDWVVDAVDALESVPESQKLDLRYEDVLNDAEATLIRFSNFIFDRDEPTEEELRWARKEAESVRRPSLKFPSWTRASRSRLQAACQKGLELLGYV